MQYTSCFVGIPLPDKFQRKFENILVKVKDLYPNWQIVYPKTPHITIYYLDKQSQYSISQITQIVSEKTKSIKNISLTIKSFAFFGKKDQRHGVVYLNVIYPPELTSLNQQLALNLNHYHTPDDNLPFHPHLTIARIDKLKNFSSLEKSVKNLNSNINQTDWKFEISEVVIYGVNSKVKPQHQKKLVSIRVSKNFEPKNFRILHY